jgi:hypothetical protein
MHGWGCVPPLTPHHMDNAPERCRAFNTGCACVRSWERVCCAGLRLCVDTAVVQGFEQAQARNKGRGRYVIKDSGWVWAPLP